MTVLAISMVPSSTLAMPKSPSLIMLFLVRKMFCVLRSRWRMCSSCMYWSASEIWMNQLITSASGKYRMRLFSISVDRSPPSQYAMTMHSCRLLCTKLSS